MTTHPTPTTVLDAHQIDLNRHGLIEASAGTGKTYTIENLVVRVLMEQPALALENILLVTFTEKAASELKVRIRQKIETVLTSADITAAVSNQMTETLDAFDQASIYTIHGFCHSLLREFAFENDTPFQTELVDDHPLYEKALREQMRSVWPEQYGPLLPTLLSISGFTQNGATYFNDIIAIASGGLRPEAGDYLQPDPDSADIKSLLAAFSTITERLKSKAGPESGFIAGYEKLNFNARSRQAILDRVLMPLGRWLTNTDPENPDLIGFAQLLPTMADNKKFEKVGPAAIKPDKYNRNLDNADDVCPTLDEVICVLTELMDVFSILKHLLAAESIIRLRQEVDNLKRSRGWISYHDMLQKVHAALFGPRAGHLLMLLRQRYRYAFVDEFQDTDPIQWQIFERVFIDSEACRLFLIGDPKQAIYSFRGADVFTYLSARTRLLQLTQQNRANCYQLNTNYRSTPSMVAAFNRLFANTWWFHSHGKAGWDQIEYHPASSPKKTGGPQQLVRDESRRAAVNLVDLRDATKPSQARSNLARFIAAEITHLVADSRITLLEREGSPRPIDFGDIAILVRNQSNVPLLETELASHQIPYSYYRKPGLFASQEASDLSLILNAALNPLDTTAVKMALLTPFFRFSTDDLYACDTLPGTHPTPWLFSVWHEMACGRRWGELFQSILTDTGLPFREARNPGWDRMEANYHQIAAYLNDIAYRKNLDFQGLCAHLDGLRQRTKSAGETGDIHEIETEARKVQILTMHGAKGLQFPVVFIAGGLTQGKKDHYHSFHRVDPDYPSGTRRVVDLTRSANPDQYRRESTDEDKRLFYVALTRALFKLYVPFYPALDRRPHYGPACRFMASAITEVFQNPPTQENITWLIPAVDNRTKNDHPVTPDVSRLYPLPSELLPDSRSFTHRTTALESFSSIHAKQIRPNKTDPMDLMVTSNTTGFREDDEAIGRVDSEPILPAMGVSRPANEIPSGPQVGSMFHDILETIDFSAVINSPDTLLTDKATCQFIDQRMTLYGVDLKYRFQVIQVISDTLTTPVPQIASDFVLGKLAPTDRLHEVAFYYSDPGSRNRFIRGVIDLVFRYREKYYIADWKSNRLDSGYHYAALATCMDASGYHLQYHLYTIALLRWLKKIRGNHFDPSRHFGGVFYLFLRGMVPQTGQGIYFIPPNEVKPYPG